MLSRWIWGRQLAHKSHLFEGFAASIAFHLMLAAAPFLGVMLALAALFAPFDLTAGIGSLLERIIPAQTVLDVRQLIRSAVHAGGRGLVTTTFALAVWTTSSFMTHVVMALRTIFAGNDPKPPRGWVNRLYSFLLLLAWGAILMGAALAQVVAPGFEKWLAGFGLLSAPALLAAKLLRHGLIFLMLYAVFWSAYRITSARRYPRPLVRQSALFATLGWIVLGFAFSHFFAKIWTASVIYGALGSIVGTLIWAYLSAWIVLIGACLVVRRTPERGRAAPGKS